MLLRIGLCDETASMAALRKPISKHLSRWVWHARRWTKSMVFQHDAALLMHAMHAVRSLIMIPDAAAGTSAAMPLLAPADVPHSTQPAAIGSSFRSSRGRLVKPRAWANDADDASAAAAFCSAQVHVIAVRHRQTDQRPRSHRRAAAEYGLYRLFWCRNIEADPCLPRRCTRAVLWQRRTRAATAARPRGTATAKLPRCQGLPYIVGTYWRRMTSLTSVTWTT